MKENNNYASVVSIHDPEDIGKTNMSDLNFLPYFQFFDTASF